MDIKEFKEKIRAARDESDIDDLCFTWLYDLSADWGNEGKTAKVLLELSQSLMSIR